MQKVLRLNILIVFMTMTCILAESVVCLVDVMEIEEVSQLDGEEKTDLDTEDEKEKLIRGFNISHGCDLILAQKGYNLYAINSLFEIQVISPPPEFA